jgi:tight adherence protein B
MGELNPQIAQLIVLALVFGCVLLAAWAARSAYFSWKSSSTEVARASMRDLFLFIDPSSIFRVNLALFLLLPLITWVVTRSPPITCMVAVGGAVLPRLAWSRLRKRRREMLIQQLPDGLTMMSGSLRAGAGLQAALGMVVQEMKPPLSQEFSLLLREQRLGLALEDSMSGMAQRLVLEEVDLFVSAVTIAKEVGGNLSEILERLASTLRAKATMEGKIRALTAQGKLQGIIVGALPIFLAVVLYFMDPEAMGPILTTYYGWAVIAVIAVLLTLGGFFIKKIVTIDV